MNNYRKSETGKISPIPGSHSDISDALKRESWLAGVCPFYGSLSLPLSKKWDLYTHEGGHRSCIVFLFRLGRGAMSENFRPFVVENRSQ